MTTGAPLYLVSACASAEEFVAAFRRYADRTGLFVPIAEPLPQGRRGRIALTLNDGRILLESEVEVAAASARPSPLYGRVGMTLKFIEPDTATKTALGELEKARLAMKPAPLSVVPRASDVAATPRPTPPPVGGRIDASNALAECVAIGDFSGWADGKSPETSSGKFVIPTIPQMGAPRPKSPSVPPALQPKFAEPKPPPVPGTPPPIALPPKIVTPPIGVPSSKAEQKMTTMGMPAIDRLPAIEPKPEPKPEPEMPVVSATATKQGITPPPMATTMGMPPIARTPDPTPVVPRRDPTPLPKKNETVQIPKREIAIGKQTTLGMPIVRPPADTMESPSPPPPTPVSTGAAAPRRAHTPSTPPAPRHPTPYAPLPIVRKPASDAMAPLVDLSETTDVTEAPAPPLVGEEQRKTSLGVSRLTASPVAPVETSWDDESKPTQQQAAVEAPADVVAPAGPSRSGGLRASEIMAAMKGEDWTMTPDASSPTVLPKPADPATDPNLRAAEEKSGPLPGDWAISLDPASPGGWSKPAKVEKPPELKAPAAGNRNIAVASAQAIEAVEWEEKPTGIGEALVQIDPTLMEPAKPMPIDDEEPVNIVSTPLVDVPPPATLPPPFGLPAPLGAPVGIPTPPPWAANATNLPLAAPAPTPMAQPPALPPPPMGPPPRLPTTPPQQASPLFAPQVPNSSAVFPALPPRVDITDGNTNFFRDSGEIPQYGADPTDSIATKRRKRTMFLVIAAAALAVIATVVVILTTGGKKHARVEHHAAIGSGSGLGSGSGSGSDQIATGSAHVETPVPPPPVVVDAAPPAPQVCSVDITTSPTGAELSLDDKTVLGTAPATVQLPCGVETKIHATKAKYGTTVKAFTASADNTKLALRIAAPMFSLKVTSLPAGATITIGSKMVGITPTTVKVQAFSSTRITLTKDGFAPDTQTIAPRVNNAAHHVVLKHATKKLR